MAITYFDSDQVNDIGDQLLSLSNEYITEINNLFQRLSEVPNGTKEWQGTQSIKFHNIVARDKTSLLKVGNQLKYIATKIKSDSAEISSSISVNNANEGKRGY